MRSEFARDLADVEGPIEAAHKERPDKPIKIRVQPTILREGVEGRAAQYKAWKDVSWMLACDTPAEAFALRDALVAFFSTLTRVGPEGIIKVLSSAGKADAA